MKLVLVNQRYGHSRTIVIKGWLKGLLSLCLLGAPVAVGLVGYQLALADEHSRRVVSHEQGVQDVKDVQEVASPANARTPLNWADSTDIVNSISHGAMDIVHSLPIADWQYETAASFVAVVPRTLAWVVQLAETHSFEPHPGTFAHGRIIDPASYLRRTHR